MKHLYHVLLPRKSKNGHGEQQYKNLDKELLFVQGELEKLAGNDKYVGGVVLV